MHAGEFKILETPLTIVNRNYTTYLELQKSADYRAVHVITPDL